MIYRYHQPKPVGPFYDYHCPVSGCPKRARQITGPIKCPTHRGQMVEDSPVTGLRAIDAKAMNERIDAIEALFRAQTSRWWRRG